MADARRSDTIVGLSGIDSRAVNDFASMQHIGISWLRLGVGFPFADESLKTPTPEFTRFIDQARRLREKGFGIMAVTPCLGGIMIDQSEDLHHVNDFGIHKLGIELSDEEKSYPDVSPGGIDRRYFQWRVPPWLREYVSDSFYRKYADLCRRIAAMTAGAVDIWQISNEMDIAASKGPLSLDQVIRFHAAGARGIKEGDPNARCSINLALHDTWALCIYEHQYRNNPELFDYAGTDGYFGTWHTGGPDSWVGWINQVHALTGKRVLIHEWGYSSAGGVPQKRTLHHPPTWEFAWKHAHTEQEQAEYIDECLRVFANHPSCAGSFFFRWTDTRTCTYCGKPQCPIESCWGLVESWTGRKKPSFLAFKDAVAKYYPK
jgi:hypothetical protein